MFGKEDHSHRAGAEPVEHAMVAENQAMRGADQDSIELSERIFCSKSAPVLGMVRRSNVSRG